MRRSWMSVFALAGVVGGLAMAAPARKPDAEAPAAAERVPEAGTEQVKASLLADAAAAAPGSTVTLGVRLKVIPHWHVYWANPGENGTATEIKPTGPAGFTFGAIQWPLPHLFKTDVGNSFGYENEVLLMVPVTVPQSAKPGTTADLAVEVNWLSCKTECIEGSAKLSIKLPIAAQAEAANTALFDAWKKQLPIDSSKLLKSVEQGIADGEPESKLKISWAAAPKKVEWFPLAPPLTAIEDIAIDTKENVTNVSYKSTVYKAEAVPGGKMSSVLVFEDETGQRIGVTVPFKVSLKKK